MVQEYDHVLGPCEHDNETSGSIEDGAFPDYHLLKKRELLHEVNKTSKINSSIVIELQNQLRSRICPECVFFK
jgi:hypothetical protein